MLVSLFFLQVFPWAFRCSLSPPWLRLTAYQCCRGTNFFSPVRRAFENTTTSCDVNTISTSWTRASPQTKLWQPSLLQLRQWGCPAETDNSNSSALSLENTAATVSAVILMLLLCRPSLGEHKHSLCPKGPQMFPIVQLQIFPEWLTQHFQEWSRKNVPKQCCMVKWMQTGVKCILRNIP